SGSGVAAFSPVLTAFAPPETFSATSLLDLDLDLDLDLGLDLGLDFSLATLREVQLGSLSNLRTPSIIMQPPFANLSLWPRPTCGSGGPVRPWECQAPIQI